MKEFIPQAGAVVYRKVDDAIQILLILSKKKPPVRIFPKGHIEPGETSLEASRRELIEEAGMSGELVSEIDEIFYDFRDKNFRVKYYLFHYRQTDSSGEPGRDPQWFSPEEARELLPFDAIRSVMYKALPLCE